MQTKDMDGLMVMWEAGSIFVLAGAAYLMSLKDKLSLEKLRQSDDWLEIRIESFRSPGGYYIIERSIFRKPNFI